MKYSKQRELILSTIVEHPTHPTADEVYTSLKGENPNLSIGTVYRNLNMLSDIGSLLKIKISNGSDRFDGRTDSHYHMICNKCGKVFDVELAMMKNLEKDVFEEKGYVITSFDIILRGLCCDCNTNPQIKTS